MTNYKIILSILALCLCTFSHAQVIDNTSSVKNNESNQYFRFHYDNDYFTATDEYYTQGITPEVTSKTSVTSVSKPSKTKKVTPSVNLSNVSQKEIKAAQKARAFQLPAELGEDGVTLRTLPTIGITARGPNNYGGRTRAIGFDKRNTQIILAGGVSSGLYRSTDGATSWTRITPAGLVHGITAVAQDPRTGQPISGQDILCETKNAKRFYI